MKLKKLNLSNFRGFEQLDIDFCDDITVIAGVNGSGKSSLLRAISGIASYCLPEFTPAKKEAFSFTDTDIYTEKPSLSISTTFQTAKQMLYAEVLRSSSLSLSKISSLIAEREDIRAQRRFVKKGLSEDTKFEERLNTIDQLLKKPEDYFSWQSEKGESESRNPLIVYYSTNRSFSHLPPRLSKVKPLTPTDAYTNSLRTNQISLNDFANWYRAAKNGLLGGEKLGVTLIQMLDSVIKAMLPNFLDLMLIDHPKPYFKVKKENIYFELEQLSEGERGILALAFDLTRRLTLANPESSNPIAEGSALVMIDEIELHLHPKWQRQVLRRLTSTFENCQFIVTTHSPLVIGEVESRCIRFLEREEEQGKVISTIPSESYGLDANRVLSELMGASERNKEVTEILHQIFKLIDDENFDEAQAMIPLIEKISGLDPEINRAQTLIKFLKGEE